MFAYYGLKPATHSIVTHMRIFFLSSPACSFSCVWSRWQSAPGGHDLLQHLVDLFRFLGHPVHVLFQSLVHLAHFHFYHVNRFEKRLKHIACIAALVGIDEVHRPFDRLCVSPLQLVPDLPSNDTRRRDMALTNLSSPQGQMRSREISSSGCMIQTYLYPPDPASMPSCTTLSRILGAEAPRDDRRAGARFLSTLKGPFGRPGFLLGVVPGVVELRGMLSRLVRQRWHVMLRA